MEVSFGQLEPSDGDSLARLYQIYSASLPPPKQKPESELCQMLTRPEYVLLVASQAEITGFAILFQAEDFGLLESLAVDPSARNAGLGARLFRAALRQLGARPLLIELHTPDERSAEFESQRRQEAFYRRLGCLRVDGLAYQRPSAQSTAPETQLFVRQEIARSLPKATLERWLKIVYAEVYARDERDLRIPAMLAPLPAVVALV